MSVRAPGPPGVAIDLPAGVAHGEYRAYKHYGCRCPGCRATNAARSRQARSHGSGWFLDARRRDMPGLRQGDPRHGSENGYRRFGCRCPHCRDAHAAAQAEYQRRRSGIPRDQARTVLQAARARVQALPREEARKAALALLRHLESELLR